MHSPDSRFGSLSYWSLTLAFGVLAGMLMGIEVNDFVGTSNSSRSFSNMLTMVPFGVVAFAAAGACLRRKILDRKVSFFFAALLYFEIAAIFGGFAIALTAALGPSSWLMDSARDRALTAIGLPLILVLYANIKIYFFMPLTMAFIWVARQLSDAQPYRPSLTSGDSA